MVNTGDIATYPAQSFAQIFLVGKSVGSVIVAQPATLETIAISSAQMTVNLQDVIKIPVNV